MQPKEDTEAKKARERERRMAKYESRQAAQETASDLRTDIGAVYGMPSMFSMRKS